MTYLHSVCNFGDKILKKLFEQKLTGVFCDVRFVKKDEIIYGHSCILASFSPLLYRLFLSSFGSNNNEIKLLKERPFDINIRSITKSEDNEMNCLNCVSEVIDFIYTGKFHVNELHKEHLINIVHNLEIEGLVAYLHEKNISNEANKFEVNKNNDLGNREKKISVSRISSKNVIKCTECSRSFISYSRFKTHIKNHKKHQCEECGFLASYRSTLKRHLLKHNKMFCCSFEDCEVRTSTKYNLKQHMITHTLEKQFICDKCCMKFSYAKNLIRHQRTIHSSERETFNCWGCCYSTSRIDKLKEHCKTIHHNNEEIMKSLNNTIEAFRKSHLKTKRRMCKSLIVPQNKNKEVKESKKFGGEGSVTTESVNTKDDKSNSEVNNMDGSSGATYILSETTGEFSIISENEGERFPVASVTSTNVLTIGNFREGTGSVTLNETTGVLTLNNINSESTGAVFLNESTGVLSFISLTNETNELREEKSAINETTQLNEVTGEMFTVLGDTTNNEVLDEEFDTFEMDFTNDESCDGFDDLDNLLFDPDPFELFIKGDENNSFVNIPHLNEATGELSFESIETQENHLSMWSSENIEGQIEDSYNLLLNEFTGELS